jgi:hypothetical protein
MSTLLTMPSTIALEAATGDSQAPPADQAIRRQVWSLLAGVYPPNKWTERRADQRFPLPQLIHLNALGTDGITPLADSIVAVGKQLSERGLGFFHPLPIPHRRMVVSLEAASNGFIGFLIDITWCRFTQYGWYESGGRFLQVLQSPVHRGEGARRSP